MRDLGRQVRPVRECVGLSQEQRARAAGLQAAAVVALALLAGCSLFHHPAPRPGSSQIGTASWYGAEFHGTRTASGDRFDPHELSAAHPTLPLGSHARVTNLANGHAVVVRINDRGPFTRGRAIDLSYAAARTIGMVGTGTARVRIEVLDGPSPRTLTGRARLRGARRRTAGRRRPDRALTSP